MHVWNLPPNHKLSNIKENAVLIFIIYFNTFHVHWTYWRFPAKCLVKQRLPRYFIKTEFKRRVGGRVVFCLFAQYKLGFIGYWVAPHGKGSPQVFKIGGKYSSFMFISFLKMEDVMYSTSSLWKSTDVSIIQLIDLNYLLQFFGCVSVAKDLTNRSINIILI